MRDDDVFCVNCGAKVLIGDPSENSVVSETDPTPEPVPEPASEPVPEPTPEPSPEPVPESAPEPSPDLTPVPTSDLTSVTVPVSVEPKKPKSKKLLICIIAGAVLLIAAVLAVFLINNVPKDYHITRFTIGGEDYLSELCQEGKAFPTGLHIKDKGEADILYSDGEILCTLSYDEKEMTGKLFGSEEDNDDFDVTVSVGDNRFIVKNEEAELEIDFEVNDTKSFDKLSGSYAITDMNVNGVSTDEIFEYYTMDKKAFVSKLEIGTDGTGYTESYAGTKTLEFTLNKKDMTFSGSALDNDGNKGEIEGYLAVYEDTVVLYNSTGNAVFSFVRSDTVDHAKYEGEYVLTGAKYAENGDWLEYCIKNKSKIVTKLIVNGDGTGKMLCADGSTHSNIALNKGETAGLLTFSSDENEEIPIFLRYQKNAVAVYVSGFRIYCFESVRDKLTEDELGEYTVTRFIYPVEGTDFLEDLVIEYGNVVTQLTLASDNAGKLKSRNGAEPQATINVKDMSVKLTSINGKEANFFAVFSKDELTLYGTDNHSVINLSKDPFSGALRLIGSEDSVKGKLISYKSKDKKENQASNMTDSYMELSKSEYGSYLYDNSQKKRLTYNQDTMTGTMDSEEKVNNNTDNTTTNTDYSKYSPIVRKAIEYARTYGIKQHDIFMTVYDDIVTVYNTEAQIVFKYQFELPEK